ncbi:hypothetical protein RJ639_013654 [Escallonia herrerae]|uniref:Uncharacterized protein n=1 Tax=Escallonia herrerae TaxID=1293975 RepID=A0AA88VKE8_9ASTE|nr:hypothetical protein RJ639_013654 [Escallonia herrerae]
MTPKESKNIASYFNWYLFSITVGSCIGVTVVVCVSFNVGRDKCFIISMGCAFAGLFVVLLGMPFYRVRVPGKIALLSVLRVLVVTAKNWAVALPQDSCELYEINDVESVTQRTHPPQLPNSRLVLKDISDTTCG